MDVRSLGSRRAGRAIAVVALVTALTVAGTGVANATGPSVVVAPTSGVSWGDTLTVTTSGYPIQESAYITICDPGTIGVVLTIAQVTAACTGEIEHRLDSGFNPDTNYGFINGANGSDTVVLTSGRPSSAHCATGSCDVVVLDHNCIDQLVGSCVYLGQAITFATALTNVVVKGRGPTLKFKPGKVSAHWSGPAPGPQCSFAVASFRITNPTKHPVQVTFQGAPIGPPISAGSYIGVCTWGTGRATLQYGLDGSVNVLTVKVR
jgi:hypothetical protein